MSTSKNSWLVPVAFINIYVIWGITFLAISFGLKGFPPFILSGFRFLAAGLLMIGWLLAKGEKANSLINWKKNAITGILILTGGTGLVAWGEQYVSASEAAIAIATGPFWFIAIDKKNWKYYFSDKFIPIGLIIGFIGLILFLNGSVSGPAHATADGTLRITAFMVLALSSVAWVLGSLYSKKNPASQSTFMNISQQLITAGIASFIIAVFRKEWHGFSFSNVPASAWAGVLFLVFFGSIVAYLSYIWLLSVKPAALVSTHTYINPIVTVFAGWIVAGQTINGNQLYGLSIILLGVLLTNVTKYFRLSKRSKVKIRRLKRFFNKTVRPYQPI
ncbi:drug/metabolite transporter (DMT)-like permease [Chryseobacterium shigense]|uniref:Drug/metabolite transporter (DMT)-like permease n=1 Tax=Chryseobacterium shigense TaxID=297244 RepID=A0A841NB05_9FLAO|nr:EamA family transporter [Chryseobacterium shigense]MBB6370560.1 drug/metabolite transporter (DMT)-like permease [Chryseobacterium shigense]